MPKNFKELSRTQPRADALTILEAGYAAIETKAIIRGLVSYDNEVLTIRDASINRGDFRHLFVVGVGKCAFQAAEELEVILGDIITDGVIIDIQGGVLERLTSYVGSHPLPSDANVTAAQAVVDLVAGATERDIVLCVISGGGSALLCLPHQVKCEELVRITHALMEAGATIQEINTVRKHLSDIQGGQLAKLAYPARVISLIFSDVPGDDLSMVASGPTVRDVTTQEDAAVILSRYNILDTCKLPDCEIVETPKEEHFFSNVSNIIAVNNVTALTAMKQCAEHLGYAVIDAGHAIQGEAKEVGRVLLDQLKPKTVVLGAGETTVTIIGPAGDGGRNQEVVLATLPLLKEQQVFISAASDGEDFGPHAGAIADETSLPRAQAAGLDASQALLEHNSSPFFKTLGDLLETGKTGSNVSDLFIALQGSSYGKT